jgi:hypothetical protein
MLSTKELIQLKEQQILANKGFAKEMAIKWLKT